MMKARIAAKLDEMNQYLSELEEILPAEEKQYLQDLTVRRACEKTIENAIEAVIDIISIIVCHQKLGLPQSEDDLLEMVKKHKILSDKLMSKIREMKGFRNILVHKYGQIDDKLSYHFLREELADFSEFESEIKKYLQKLK